MIKSTNALCEFIKFSSDLAYDSAEDPREDTYRSQILLTD